MQGKIPLQVNKTGQTERKARRKGFRSLNPTNSRTRLPPSMNSSWPAVRHPQPRQQRSSAVRDLSAGELMATGA